MLSSAAAHKQLVSSMSKAVLRTLGRHMIPVSECAKKNGVSASRIHKLIEKGRVWGAYQNDNRYWLVPSEWIHKRRKPLGKKKVKEAKIKLTDYNK